MRIWMRISGLRPGGSEQVAGALAAEARGAGHEVVLSARPDAALDAWAQERAREGLDVRRDREVESKWDWGGLLRSHRGLALAHPELVHLHQVHPTADRYLPFLIPRGAVAVATEHVRHDVDEPSQLWLKRLASRRLARVVAVSDSVRRSLVDHYGLPESQVTVIRNGVDLSRFHPGGDRARSRRELGLPAVGFVVGSAGRLTRQKGFDLLLQACAQMEGAWVLAIAGEGEEEEPLRALAAELGIAERVRWLGRLNDPAPFYAALDVFALASRWEGLPLTLLEALACGVPAAASAVDGNVEVLARGGGLLLPADSPRAMGKVLDVWRNSESLRQEVGRDAARVGRAFDWRSTWLAYAALYEEVTAWKKSISRRWS